MGPGIKILLFGIGFAFTLVMVYLLKAAFLTLLFFAFLFGIFGVVLFFAAKMIFKEND